MAPGAGATARRGPVLPPSGGQLAIAKRGKRTKTNSTQGKGKEERTQSAVQGAQRGPGPPDWLARFLPSVPPSRLLASAGRFLLFKGAVRSSWRQARHRWRASQTTKRRNPTRTTHQRACGLTSGPHVRVASASLRSLATTTVSGRCRYVSDGDEIIAVPHCAPVGVCVCFPSVWSALPCLPGVLLCACRRVFERLGRNGERRGEIGKEERSGGVPREKANHPTKRGATPGDTQTRPAPTSPDLVVRSLGCLAALLWRLLCCARHHRPERDEFWRDSCSTRAHGGRLSSQH